MRFQHDDTHGLLLKSDVCFQMPTDWDWSFDSALVQFSGSAVPDHGTNPIEI